VPLEIIFVKKFQSRYHLNIWRREFRDPLLVTWFYNAQSLVEATKKKSK